MVWYYQSQLEETSDVANSKRLRAIALTDILPGTEITSENWQKYIAFKEKASLGDYKDEIFVKEKEDYSEEELKNVEAYIKEELEGYMKQINKLVDEL